jgi:hypothetical protein
MNGKSFPLPGGGENVAKKKTLVKRLHKKAARKAKK